MKLNEIMKQTNAVVLGIMIGAVTATIAWAVVYAALYGSAK